MPQTLRSLLWSMLALSFIFLLSLPMANGAHMAVAFVALALAGSLRLFRPTGPMRMIVLAIATAVVIRYIYWRASETLPPSSDLASFIPGILLFAAECYSVMMLALSLFVVISPNGQRKAPPIPDIEAPTVDVFIPSYNEPADLLERTIAAALIMDYPKDRFRVFLLDDGGTEQKRNDPDLEKSQAAHERHHELRALCARLGATYVTRARNEHAKAGNLNNGMLYSDGDLIAVFDADHVPAPDFLRETVGHFIEDEKLFLVQTPHFFANPDPIERNLGLVGKVPSESEMFYGMIQRGLDRWNGSFFCGSAALLRRKALEQTDGFSGQSITEDCETAVALHSTGWNSRFVAKPMILGLQPETFSSFIGQRARWAAGMLQIMMLARPQLKRGLSLAQRLCYSSSIMFWLFPFARLSFLIAPIFYLLFDLKIFNATGQDFLAYTMSYMVANLIIQNFLYGSWRHPWISEIYEFTQSFHLGAALVSTMLKPRAPTFKVTAKDESATEDRRSELAPLFYWVFFALVALQIWTGYRIMTEPENFWILMVVGGWNALNLLFSMISLGVVNERASDELAAPMNERATLRSSGESLGVPAVITKANETEITLQLSGIHPARLMQDERAQVTLNNGARMLIEVSHLEGGGLSGRIAEADPEAMSHLIYNRPAIWRAYDMEQKPKGIIRGTADFVVLAFSEAARALGPKRVRKAPAKAASAAAAQKAA